MSLLFLRSSLSSLRVLPTSARLLPSLTSSSSSSPSSAFSTSVTRGEDPTKNRRNSEGTMPGAGSTDEIADSEGAFSSDATRPDEAGAQINREKPNVEMDSSAASNDNAKRSANEGNKETTKSENGTNPPASEENLGASKARKEEKEGKN